MNFIHHSAKLFLILPVACILIGFSVTPSNAAENGLSLEQRVTRIEALQQPGAPPVNTGDNAWVLVSSALVLMMTAPGLILFYGGLVRSKNVLATMMHSLILMALVSALWMVFGYSLAFAPGNGFVGDPRTYFMLRDVGGAPNADYAGTVPQQSFMLFQMMFAIITPALISGAVAERIKFKAYVLFVLLWVTVVYFPLCHMVWGKGGYFNWALGGRVPVLDFAGGTVVHINAGIAGLATITPASGFVTVPAAFCIGLTAGVVCYLAVTKLKAKFSYDDSLDVFGVHAVGSITGMLMLGFLANTLVNPAIATTFQANGVTVSLAGGKSQFIHQIEAVVFTVAFAGIASFIILKLVDKVVGLRVDVEDEDAGLDLTQHGERAYTD